MPELVRLSPAARTAAIHELVDSMLPTAADTEMLAAAPRKGLLDFAGAWNDEAEADIMEQAIAGSRYTELNTALESWD